MTNADYVAIAISPALIMALVGSLVFFLIEVLYVGQYQARLTYAFAWFVFAAVLIGRISIELGAEKALMYALPLGLAMFLVLVKFVPHGHPLSHLINLGLLTIVWFSAHKLTWDCTLIDDNEDASGEGLMQRVGVDDLIVESVSTENELFSSATQSNASFDNATADEKVPITKKRTPHTPGLWVLYFSLAALPLFGIGQKWIPPSDVGRRQYAFGLLAVYVAAGLSLLVTTSFLGLRRYLRQRRIEMPLPMAATWVTSGGVMIVVVMVLAAMVPRPHAEYAISQVPWQVRSPEGLQASRRSVGSDGTEDENPEARRVMSDQTDPDAIAKREGENPTTASDSGEQQTAGEGESEGDSQSDHGDHSDSQESQQRRNAQDSTRSDPDSRPERNEMQQNAADPDSIEGDSAPPADQTEQSREQQANESSASQLNRPTELIPKLAPMLGGLSTIVKLVLYAAMAILLCYLAWHHRRAIVRAIQDLIRQLRELLASLFGMRKPTSDAVDEESAPKTKEPPPRPFASYLNPFTSGQAKQMPPAELVRYSFEAFEAWAREQGHRRSADQTASELIREAAPSNSPLAQEARLLAQLYNQAAYSPSAVSQQAADQLAHLWAKLQITRQTPLEPVS